MFWCLNTSGRGRYSSFPGVLGAKSFGLAAGIVVSITLFGFIWHAILTDYGNEFIKIWADTHAWYSLVDIKSPLGSLVSLVDGFGHGFAYGFILIWIYNWFEKRKPVSQQ